jgi:hypothetical protein
VLFERTLRPENRGVDISCRLTEAGEGWFNMFDRQNGASSAPPGLAVTSHNCACINHHIIWTILCVGTYQRFALDNLENVPHGI